MERNFDVSGKNVLIIDDMISTGGTMVKAAENLKKAVQRKSDARQPMDFPEGFTCKIEGMCDFVFASDTIPNEVSEVKIGDFVANL